MLFAFTLNASLFFKSENFRFFELFSFSILTSNTVFKRINGFLLVLFGVFRCYFFIFTASFFLFISTLFVVLFLWFLTKNACFWVYPRFNIAKLVRSKVEVLKDINATIFEFFLLKEVIDIVLRVEQMNRSINYSLLNLVDDDFQRIFRFISSYSIA